MGALLADDQCRPIVSEFLHDLCLSVRAPAPIAKRRPLRVGCCTAVWYYYPSWPSSAGLLEFWPGPGAPGSSFICGVDLVVPRGTAGVQARLCRSARECPHFFFCVRLTLGRRCCRGGHVRCWGCGETALVEMAAACMLRAADIHSCPAMWLSIILLTCPGPTSPKASL